MKKNDFTYSLDSTEENQTPDPIKSVDQNLAFQRNNFPFNDKSERFSPLELSCFSIGSPFTTAVPQLDYLKYRERHFSKRNAKSPRFQSESPNFNYFYQPQTIRVSPRSNVKVFSYFPILKEKTLIGTKQKIQIKKKNLQKFSNQPRILPTINQKSTKPEYEMKPAMTYGEKLWKLYELAAIEKKN